MSLSLAVGFSVSEKPAVDYLEGKADIALIGTQAIRMAQNRGICSFGDFIIPNLRFYYRGSDGLNIKTPFLMKIWASFWISSRNHIGRKQIVILTRYL